MEKDKKASADLAEITQSLKKKAKKGALPHLDKMNVHEQTSKSEHTLQ